MKFGKEFRIHMEETLPAWRDKFLCYQLLKKLIKHFPTTSTTITIDSLPPRVLLLLLPYLQSPIDVHVATSHGLQHSSSLPLVDLHEWFVRILNQEINKFNEFFFDQEEYFIIRFQDLKERRERVKEKSNSGRISTSESEFSEEMMEIRKDFVNIHGKMVLLKNYSSLNFAGLVKIVKKFDKRTGGFLCIPFTQLALRQPFFTIEPLTRLVCECEAIIEHIFPLEAEVIELIPTTQEKSNQLLNYAANLLSKTPPSELGEETGDVYRSTLAAMEAIRGLQKASSTYNPLSISSLLRSQDDASSEVTAENSAANSSASLQTDQEDG